MSNSYEKFTVPQLKSLMDHNNIKYSSSFKKIDYLNEIKNWVNLGNVLNYPNTTISNHDLIKDDCKKSTVTQLKSALTKLNVSFKSTDKKTDLCDKLKNKVAPVPVVAPKSKSPSPITSSSSPITTSPFKDLIVNDCKNAKVAQLKDSLKKLNVSFKSTDRKADLCDKLKNKVAPVPVVAPKSKSPSPVVNVPTTSTPYKNLIVNDCKNAKVAQLKDSLKKLNVSFKSTDRKADLCDKLKNKVAPKVPVVAPKSKSPTPVVVAPKSKSPTPIVVAPKSKSPTPIVVAPKSKSPTPVVVPPVSTAFPSPVASPKSKDMSIQQIVAQVKKCLATTSSI